VLHDRGIVHGGLNPDYLLLEGNVLKLVDPGLSCVLSQYFGTTVNNPLAYFAPEQLRQVASAGQEATAKGDKVGPLADMYTVGCLIVQLYTDQFPWQGTEDLIQEVLTRKRTLPQLLLVDEEDVKVFASRCLDPDPSRRPDAKAFQNWTRRFYKPTGDLATPRKEPTSKVIHKEKTRWGEPLHCMPANDAMGAKGIAFAYGFGLRWLRCNREFLLRDDEMMNPKNRDLSSPHWLGQFSDMEQMLLHCNKRKADALVPTLQRANSIVSVDDPGLRSTIIKEYHCAEAHRFSVKLQAYLRTHLPVGRPPRRPTTLFVVDGQCRELAFQAKDVAFPVVEETKRLGTDLALHVTGFYSETGQVSPVGRDLARLVVDGLVVDDPCPPPAAFACSLSGRIMRNPVMAGDGYTYEKTNFDEYARTTSPLVSPTTRLPLPTAETQPMEPLQNSIVQYEQERQWWLQRLSVHDIVIVTAKVREAWREEMEFVRVCSRGGFQRFVVYVC
jgi:hypothetical protein